MFPRPILVRPDVLVESYVDGTPIDRFMGDDTDVELKKRIAHVGCQLVLKMVFTHNFIHADLHPGNVLARLGAGTSGDAVSPLSRERLGSGDLSRESARGVQNSQESVPTRYIEWDKKAHLSSLRSLEGWIRVSLLTSF